ncbi:MAG TPA: TonB-dependent receptor [Opitutaceae bacterium]
MHIPTRILLLSTAFSALTALHAQTNPGAAPAAPVASTDPAITLEALKVTADLWASPLDRIPASVTVIDSAALADGSIRHFGDLVDRIPNLTWTGGTNRPRYFQIRGIGENSQFEGETPDSAVRFLVDDLDFTGLGSLGGTFDVSQVEVLRGPQAGAFGANAAGGLIRLVSNAPTPHWTGLVEATVGEDDLRAGGIAIGGPLIASQPNQLMARLSVHQSESDGFRRNLTLNADTNARDEFTARLRLIWNPNTQWNWDGTLLYSDLNNGYDVFALDNNGTSTYSDQPGRDEQESTAASLRGTYTGSPVVRFTTITSGAAIDSIYSYDDDWTAASYMGFSDLRRERAVFNQEFRLDSTASQDAAGWIDRWTVGAYYAQIDEDSLYTNEDPWTLRGLATDYRSRNLALFGQIGHDLGARSRLVLGLRLEQIDLKGTGLSTRLNKDNGTSRVPVTARPSFDDTLTGGKISYEFDLTPRHLLFASITRGYKGGGINVDARIDPASDPLTYATEDLWNYEIGFRGNWLDQRLTGELTAFHLTRHDAQVRDSAGFGGSYRFFTDNANQATVTGLESSAALRLSENWTVRGSLALLDSELDPFTLSNGNTGGGRRLAATPKHGYTFGIGYRPESGLFANVDLTGRARQYDSNNQNEERSAFNVLNASLGYTWRSWTFTLWARNLTDEVYENRVYFFGNEDPDYTETRYETRADPRQFGVTAAYRF